MRGKQDRPKRMKNALCDIHPQGIQIFIAITLLRGIVIKETCNSLIQGKRQKDKKKYMQ